MSVRSPGTRKTPGPRIAHAAALAACVFGCHATAGSTTASPADRGTSLRTNGEIALARAPLTSAWGGVEKDLGRLDSSELRDNTLRGDVIRPICVEPELAEAVPTCNFGPERGERGIKMKQLGLGGAVRWCAGGEPLPWASSARKAPLDATYASLGLAVRPERAELVEIVDHSFAVVALDDIPVLVSTSGSEVALRWSDGRPATGVFDAAAVYPPSKGALLRFPSQAGSVPPVRIDASGEVTAIAKPNPRATFAGWSTSGGGSDSLWRWSEKGNGERWGIVHHRADGSTAGAVEVLAPPTLCEQLDHHDPELRFRTYGWLNDQAHPGRGARIALRDGGLCVDAARPGEDDTYWQHPADRQGAQKVSCAAWRLELDPAGGGRVAAASPAN